MFGSLAQAARRGPRRRLAKALAGKADGQRRLLRYSALGPLELLGVAARESARALWDPYLRGDSVAAVGEATGQAALERLAESMRRDDTGRRILLERPLLNAESVDFERLASLSPRTLGGAYARYMSMHGFAFGERPKVKLIEDPELAFVMQRYRDTHDILHALCGVPVSVTGEVALKWFELVQTGLPMTALAALFGTARAEAPLSGSSQASVLGEYINWCSRAGRRSKLFLNVYFEEHWGADLLELRRELRLPRQPQHLASLDASWDPSRAAVMRAHYEASIAALQSDRDPRRKEPFVRYLCALDGLQGPAA